jgi:hypothetical protein
MIVAIILRYINNACEFYVCEGVISILLTCFDYGVHFGSWRYLEGSWLLFKSLWRSLEGG